MADTKRKSNPSFAQDAADIQNHALHALHERLFSYERLLSSWDPLKRAEMLDRIHHANLGKMTTGLSPAAVLIAFTDWYAHIAIAPNVWLQLLEDAAQKLVDFYSTFFEYTLHHDSKCFNTTDERFHQRFKSQDWQQWPFCAIAQGFLTWESWWHAATNIRGVEKNHKELVSFVRFQWINALSPENYPFLNPEVINKTLQTGGHNLINGWQHWMEDSKRYLKGERPVGTERFQVGRDVALTQGKVVFRNELIELIQYAPKTKSVYPEPILIIPAWIMKYYILDLSPQNSMVTYLVEQGHTVFMISWKNPDASYRDFGMEDYLKTGVLAALDAVNAITHYQPVHATGYCIGGTLLTIAASYLARNNEARLKTLTLFAAQTDFEQAGELMTFIDENQLCYLEDIMFSQGYLRGDQLSAAFELLRPKKLIWSKRVQRYFLGEEHSMNDLMAWNEDTTRLPYKMHFEYLRHFHLNNDLAEGDYLIDGEPIALDDIKAPLFVVTTEKDHIAPWESVYKIHLYSGGVDITFVLNNKGHNGGIVSEPGHPGRQFRIGKTSAGSLYKAPQDWLKAHQSRQGSWWPKWHRWLADQSGKKEPPPSMGAPQDGYSILEDAPGTYVKET